MISQNVFNSHYKLEEEREVIVVQMGKVGSTSLVESLKSFDVATTQSHFITLEAIQKIVDNFVNTDLHEQTAYHSLVQSFVNTILLNKVGRYKAQDQNRKEKRLKLISIVRDPLTWYFSNLSQNFHEYQDDVFAYSDEKGPIEDDEKLKEVIYRFVKDMLDLYKQEVGKIDEDSQVQYAELMKRFKNDPKKKILIKQFWILRRPHLWFQMHLDPLLDKSIFDLSFDPEKGYLIDNGGFYDLLIFRFEDIKDKCNEAIKSFLSIDDFSLKRLNISTGKSIGKAVNEVRDRVFKEIPPKDLYVSSKYMEMFYSDKLK